jgi:hypothetical protein
MSEGIGIGLGYERAIINNFSITGYFDCLILNGASAFDVLVRPRFYPFRVAAAALALGVCASASAGIGVCYKPLACLSQTPAYNSGLRGLLNANSSSR